MGKGKGTFEFWACRAPVGKVIFEVGGGGIAEQVAKDGELAPVVVNDGGRRGGSVCLCVIKGPVTLDGTIPWDPCLR